MSMKCSGTCLMPHAARQSQHTQCCFGCNMTRASHRNPAPRWTRFSSTRLPRRPIQTQTFYPWHGPRPCSQGERFHSVRADATRMQNLAMSTAMTVTHAAMGNQQLADAARMTQQRTRALIAAAIGCFPELTVLALSTRDLPSSAAGASHESPATVRARAGQLGGSDRRAGPLGHMGSPHLRLLFGRTL
jgi:hypothetical protein